MEQSISFNHRQFDRLFPFYFAINADLQIIEAGCSLQKLMPELQGKKFSDIFIITRPKIALLKFENLKSSTNVIIIECIDSRKLTLRGQIEYIPEKNALFFLGSPWFQNIEEVIENNLTLNDFAYHDPLIDLLHILKTQDNTNEDLKYLLRKINYQKR